MQNATASAKTIWNHRNNIIMLMYREQFITRLLTKMVFAMHDI